METNQSLPIQFRSWTAFYEVLVLQNHHTKDAIIWKEDQLNERFGDKTFRPGLTEVFKQRYTLDFLRQKALEELLEERSKEPILSEFDVSLIMDMVRMHPGVQELGSLQVPSLYQKLIRMYEKIRMDTVERDKMTFYTRNAS